MNTQIKQKKGVAKMKRFLIINLMFLFLITTAGFAKKCSYCHKEEAKQFKASVHNGEIECTDCHADADKSHKKGFKSVVDCLSCHDKMEGIKDTVHAKAMFDKKDEVYKCWECHTKHSILPSKNEFSSVNKCNLKETCTKCHKEIAGVGFLGKFAKFKISAHEKIYAGYDYSDNNCLNCHHGKVVHGEKNINPSNCNKCHNKNSFKFHTSTDIYVGLWVFIAFLFLIAVILCVTAKMKKRIRKEDE